MPRLKSVVMSTHSEKPCTLLLVYDSALTKEAEFMEKLEQKDEDIKVTRHRHMHSRAMQHRREWREEAHRHTAQRL